MGRIQKTIFQLAMVFVLAVLPSLAQAQPTIQSISPSSANAGDTLTVTITLQGDIPPADARPNSVKIGTLLGTNITWNGSAVTAAFTIPGSEAAGTKDVAVEFPAPTQPITVTKTGGFQVLSGSSGGTGSLKVTLSPSDAVNAGAKWQVDGGSWQASEAIVSDLSAGTHTLSFSTVSGWTSPSGKSVTVTNGQTTNLTETYTQGTTEQTLSYSIADTGQSKCYNASTEMTCPSSGADFYGQDAQYAGNPPSYTLSSDGKTVYDNVTKLTWMKGPNTTLTSPVSTDKKTYTAAQTWVATVNSMNYGGFGDWRLPTIKELYSLIKFNGTDPSGYEGTDTSGLTPFIDTAYFNFAYGQTGAGERIIDSQYASSNLYVSNTANDGGGTLFGVNFADGRIKGYGLQGPNGSEKTFFVQLVRGNTSYGVNSFTDNGDETITDKATGLMWSKSDSASGMNWQEALAYIQTKNAQKYLGHNDWRLPNAKELHSILDYTRSPDTTNSAAINTIFDCTQITNEGGVADYPWYWASTTHATYNGMGAGVYIAFGRAGGWQKAGATCYTLYDVHGAGAQRSDPKTASGIITIGTACSGGTAYGLGPQGDAQRAENYVRLVRDAEISSVETGSLTVTISPATAVSAGAQWQIDGGEWQNSGAMVSDLSVGNHTVSFKTVDGWTAPVSQSISITVDETKTITASYIEICIKGNIDGIGAVTLADFILALKVLTNMNPAGVFLCADVNNDGKIGTEDAVYILWKLSLAG